MKGNRFIQVLCACILLCFVAQPAVAFIDPGIIVSIMILNDKPGYQYTSKEYTERGDFRKVRYEHYSARYDDRMRAYERERADIENLDIDMSQLDKPTAAQRYAVMGTGFHSWNPDAAEDYTYMMEACGNAQRNYNMAFQMTKDDDYTHKAEILEAGAGIYNALGMYDEEQRVKDAATAARAHETLSRLFDPLPEWLAVLGIARGLFLVRSGRRK